jgi:hypothetical protein
LCVRKKEKQRGEMRKPRQVNEGTQTIEALRRCLRDMTKPAEITDFAETPEPKTTGDPFDDLRDVLQRAIAIETGDHHRRQN